MGLHDDQIKKGSVAVDWVNAQMQKSDDHFKNWIKEAAKTVAYDDLNEHDAREKLRVAIARHYANANNFDVQTEYDARLPQLMKSIELQRGWKQQKEQRAEARRVLCVPPFLRSELVEFSPDFSDAHKDDKVVALHDAFETISSEFPELRDEYETLIEKLAELKEQQGEDVKDVQDAINKLFKDIIRTRHIFDIQDIPDDAERESKILELFTRLDPNFNKPLKEIVAHDPAFSEAFQQALESGKSAEDFLDQWVENGSPGEQRAARMKLATDLRREARKRYEFQTKSSQSRLAKIAQSRAIVAHKFSKSYQAPVAAKTFQQYWKIVEANKLKAVQKKNAELSKADEFYDGYTDEQMRRRAEFYTAKELKQEIDEGRKFGKPNNPAAAASDAKYRYHMERVLNAGLNAWQGVGDEQAEAQLKMGKPKPKPQRKRPAIQHTPNDPKNKPWQPPRPSPSW